MNRNFLLVVNLFFLLIPSSVFAMRHPTCLFTNETFIIGENNREQEDLPPEIKKAIHHALTRSEKLNAIRQAINLGKKYQRDTLEEIKRLLRHADPKSKDSVLLGVDALFAAMHYGASVQLLSEDAVRFMNKQRLDRAEGQYAILKVAEFLGTLSWRSTRYAYDLQQRLLDMTRFDSTDKKSVSVFAQTLGRLGPVTMDTLQAFSVAAILNPEPLHYYLERQKEAESQASDVATDLNILSSVAIMTLSPRALANARTELYSAAGRLSTKAPQIGIELAVTLTKLSQLLQDDNAFQNHAIDAYKKADHSRVQWAGFPEILRSQIQERQLLLVRVLGAIGVHDATRSQVTMTLLAALENPRNDQMFNQEILFALEQIGGRDVERKLATMKDRFKDMPAYVWTMMILTEGQYTRL